MHVPSIREVRILVDPAILTDPASDPRAFTGIPRWTPLKVLSNYLARLGEGLGFQLLLPADLLGAEQARTYDVFLPPNRCVMLRDDCTAMPYFDGCTVTRSHLVALANQEKAHLILSEDPVLNEQCSPDRINPPALAVSWERMLDVLECHLLGHGVFHSFNDAAQGRWLETFFQSSHPTNKWLITLFSRVQASCDPNSRELFRSFAFNRYPFILLARALIHFYRWQSLWYKRESVEKLHSFLTTFYLNWAYLLMWGALDHLCLLQNSIHAYGFKERKCGMHQDFIAAIRLRHPKLAAFLESEKIARFRAVLADMRHAAAHRVLPMPATILAETDESAAPEERLRAEVAQDLDDELPGLDPLLREQLLAHRVQMRRLELMTTVADSVVYMKRGVDSYLYHPYISLDYDIDCLNQISREFLAACFPDAPPTPAEIAPS